MEQPWTEGTPVLAIARQLLPLGRNTLLMGILRIAFQTEAVDTAQAQALLLVHQGAHVLDIGAESTQPRATPVSLEVELERLLPVLAHLRTDPRFAHSNSS